MSESDSEVLHALIARVALGDQAGLRSLYDRTSAHLFGVILRISKRRDLAEELLQETYVSAWHNAAGYDPRQGLPMTWLISIARNKALDQVRSATARREIELPRDEEGLERDIPDEGPDPLSLLAAAGDALAVRQCLEAADSRQRQSLALAYYHGLSHSEVAERLESPLGTVKAWIRRGLESLKRCLDRRE
ncbi:MAG TPA: sigma-70 family RNA polymerase sigma factor [Rhodocyclaceae bacterium]|nr:sigma-70 family RNA polymerase sigma factor [Rhodocyclaceae bacterium]HMV21756.1 sigma-70 family RNA polymerase sigma factor [Rhodocyclaceae bacterium]HMW76821.1 sigma-70 family RNA polymerase sigma factor [Rhodocyclaceae bacterium]HNE43228.1 sigma-70 family RNA polymerase sigma factor [Rhodocyclaceae bacterium]HNL20926.1 sigma-70 family RNA polymerase sigma factor [Rhodocyclaceae bacterium]